MAAGRPTLVTLTVGANDFGWSELFLFAQRLCAPNRDAFRVWGDGVVRMVEDNLVGQVDRRLAHPNVEVILTDYYNPTNTSRAFWELVNPLCLFVWLAAFTEPGPGTLIGAAAQAPFTVDP